MKIKIWILSSCIPEDAEPCMPLVFTSEETAQRAFETAMRDEWQSCGDWNADGTERLPFPGAAEAHTILSRIPEWGHWEITAHEIEVAPPSSELDEAMVRFAKGQISRDEMLLRLLAD